MDKMALRSKFLAQRMSITEKEWQVCSQKICEHLLKFCLASKNVSQIFLFHAIHKEVVVHSLGPELSKQFEIALPRVSGKELEFHQWELNTSLVKNSFTIEEPHLNTKVTKANEHTIVFVPNLAMDKDGYRLGYGGGFYDKFLSKNPNVISIGVNFSEFIVEELPRDSWDRKVQWMCTEFGVVKVTEQQP